MRQIEPIDFVFVGTMNLLMLSCVCVI